MATFFLLIIYLAFISLGLPDSLLGSAWPIIRGELGAPLGTAGVLYMIVAAGTIVSSLASGSLLGRFGTGKVTLVSCLMTAAALLGYSAAPSVFWLAVCAIPLGLGAGAVDAGLNNYVAAHYKAHHMSWLHCFWGVGATLGPVIMAGFMSGGGHWRSGYLTVSMIQFALVVILLFSLPLWDRVARIAGGSRKEELSELEAEQPDTGPVKPLRIPGVKLALVSFLFYCGVESTVGLWGSSYLVGIKGVDAATAASWVSLYFAGITVGRFIAGFVTFKVSNRVMIRAGQIIALLGAVVLVLPLPAALSLVGLLIIGLGLAPIYPCMLHETPVRFGKRQSPTIMGYQMAVAYTGSTFMPPLLGFLASHSTIGVFPVYIVLSAAAMWLFSERLNVFLKARSHAPQESVVSPQ
ncbi:MFS transporter [Paenibacillus phoenicis]|uniref:MFS transporter n=1 Tax=Paenibacillus phoenicis TaxID=554117 RepID=A0ABU5PPR4_9BACL|nr:MULTISPECIES: MFS transporter [Paenibacillus]EES74494.1 transporter, major facilitator family protein [Paenibacillus sp. oral taxon 786 str. D14]MEA3571624.1 MFS transporter [Paenibacillus phoenicis]